MQTVCAGAMNLIAGPSWSVATFAAVIPARAARVVVEPQQRLEGRRQLLVELVGAWRGPACPASSAAAIVGEVWRSATAAGSRSLKQAGRVGEEGPDPRQGRRSPPRSVGGPSEIDSWMNGRATSASAVKVVSRSSRTSAPGSRRPARPRRRWRRAPWTNPARLVSGEARLRITGSSTSSTPGRRPSAEFSAGPRPASALPNSTRFSCDGEPGRLVERAEHRVELDRLRGRRRRAASRCPPRSPRRSRPG